MPALSFALAFALAFALVSSAAAQQDLRDSIEAYRTDQRDLDRYYSVDSSRRKEQRVAEFAAEWRKRLDGVDWSKLSPDARIDWLLLSDRIESDRAERGIVSKQIAQESALLPFLEPIAALEQGRWELAPIDGEAIAKELERLTVEVKAVADSVTREGEPAKDQGPQLSRPHALQVASRVDDARAALDRFSYHYLRYEPEADWWLAQPVKALGAALDAYRDKLRKEIAGKKGDDDDPLVGEPIGRDRLLAGLRRERIAYTPEELVAIGEADLARCDALMLESAKELGCDSIAAALEIVKSHAAKPGEQDDYVKLVADESIAFLDKNDLVTIPDLCRETWRVDMMPLQEQRFLPFAAYGGQCMVVNYAADDQSQSDRAQRMADNNRHFTRNVTPHELIPGHHLQGFMGQRHRPYRSMFSTPFLGEGWCLYWEFRYFEMGWAKSPEDRLGMLFWRRHRAARVIVSLKYHLGTMQPDEMIAFLKDRVGWGEGAAKGEVRRFLEGGYGPLYQCGYLIGGIQIHALHAELVPTGKLSERAFHDAVLQQNSIPIDLIRARLSGGTIERDAAPSWRFANVAAASGR